MSATTVEAVLASDLQPTGLRMVALVMAWHASNDAWQCWASLGTIAAEAGCSRAWIKRSVRALTAAGVIECVRTSKGGNNLDTAVYAFLPAWVDAQPTRVPRNPGTTGPGYYGSHDPGTTGPRPGYYGTPKNNERSSPTENSLSLKTRGTASPSGSRARGARPAGKPPAKAAHGKRAKYVPERHDEDKYSQPGALPP
jgi:hypothetical protein